MSAQPEKGEAGFEVSALTEFQQSVEQGAVARFVGAGGPPVTGAGGVGARPPAGAIESDHGCRRPVKGEEENEVAGDVVALDTGIDVLGDVEEGALEGESRRLDSGEGLLDDRLSRDGCRAQGPERAPADNEGARHTLTGQVAPGSRHG